MFPLLQIKTVTTTQHHYFPSSALSPDFIYSTAFLAYQTTLLPAWHTYNKRRHVLLTGPQNENLPRTVHIQSQKQEGSCNSFGLFDLCRWSSGVEVDDGSRGLLLSQTSEPNTLEVFHGRQGSLTTNQPFTHLKTSDCLTEELQRAVLLCILYVLIRKLFPHSQTTKAWTKIGLPG